MLPLLRLLCPNFTKILFRIGIFKSVLPPAADLDTRSSLLKITTKCLFCLILSLSSSILLLDYEYGKMAIFWVFVISSTNLSWMSQGEKYWGVFLANECLGFFEWMRNKNICKLEMWCLLAVRAE